MNGQLDIEYVSFRERADRSNYLARRFRPYLRDSVLDVGCDQAVLKALLPGCKYFGLDVGGTPDLVINLERVDRLPFDDDTYGCCVCTDVLEHLDNLHHMFAELVRVTSKNLVVSLPNNWTNARNAIGRGRGEIAHYGLPSVPPPDRHKWFFGLSEAIDFLRAQEQRYHLRIVDLVVNEKSRAPLLRLARRARYPVLMDYLNRYAHTVWAVYEKTAH